MTVRLAIPYKGQNVGTLYAGADEAALVASGQASLLPTTGAGTGPAAATPLIRLQKPFGGQGIGTVYLGAGGAGLVADGTGSYEGTVGAGSSTGVPTPTPSTTGMLAANRLGIAVETVSYTNTTTFRIEHTASPEGAVSDMQTLDAGFFYNASFLLSNIAATFQIKRAIEYPIGGTIYPVTFGGSDTGTVPVGGVLKSDPVAGLTIPAGAKFAERTTYVGGAAKALPNRLLPAASTALGVIDGKAVGDFALAGTIPADTASVNNYGATAIIGTIAKAGARAMVSVGDSIDFGVGDITGASAMGSVGYVARLYDPLMPHLKLARGSQQAAHHAAILQGVGLPALLAQIGFTHVAIEAGLNDLSLASRTAAQVIADRATIAGIAAFSGKKIMQHTITARTDSTDAWATTANQTPKTDGNMADLTPLNTAIRGLSNLVDAADADMTARNSNIHAGPFPPTTDGVHPTTAKAADIASKLAGGLAL